MALSQLCFSLTAGHGQHPTMVLMRVKAILWQKALPPPVPILFPSGKNLCFLSRLSLLSEATKGRQAIFTKHGKHEVLGVRRLVPVGPEFTCTITCFFLLWDKPALGWTPHTDCCFSHNTQQVSVTKKKKHHTHLNTCACVSAACSERLEGLKEACGGIGEIKFTLHLHGFIQVTSS